MKVLFVEYPKCSTCKKAGKWLKDHDVEFDDRHIVEENPTAEELKEWHAKSGLPLKRFFNTSGQVYRNNGIKDKLPRMSEPLCAFMNRDHLLADKEEIYLEDLIPYTLLFPRGNAITKKNVLKNAKEKAGIELRLEEIPYSLILHTSIYEGYCRCDTGKCVPICRFSGINL